MQTNKVIFYENLLSLQECDEIKTSYDQFIKENSKNDDASCPQVPANSTIGLIRPFFQLKNVSQILDVIQKNIDSVIKEDFGKNSSYSHAFLRIYKNGSCLRPHIDKSDLNITLTINIAGLENWPIHISNIEIDEHTTEETLYEKHSKDFATYYTPKGSGVACYGNLFPHWRDTLICKDDEYMMQLFLHWKTF